MNSATVLAQAVGIAYAAGLNIYATIAIVGIASRLGWLSSLPSGLAAVGSTWVIGIATVLYLVEFSATLVPGIASAWDTVHSLIRPPAAAALAAATAWHGDPIFVLLAALLGGGMAVTTHATKLGMRYAIDTSPEPVTNATANVAELGLVATMAIMVWHHPFVALVLGLVVLMGFILMVRFVWRVLRQVFSGNWMPHRGLLREPRAAEGESLDDE